MQLPPPASEAKALAELKRIAAKNQVLKSFIGQGYHGTHTPGVILRNILENPAWYTAYTPYQAEISQGRMEALVNFQQMVCDLTGMAIANASMLDEATAAAEAMTLARRSVKSASDTIIVAGDCHPQTIDIVAQAVGTAELLDLLIAERIILLYSPSGAGKTSLLRLLFMSLHPTDGQIHMFNQDVSHVTAQKRAQLRRRIGIVFQDFRLLDHLTTWENVALPLRVVGKRINDYREDVTDLLLNLKQVPLRLHGEGPKILTIDVKGPREVKAGDLMGDPAVEICDPEARIATVNEEGHLQMEIQIKRGRGYVATEKNIDESLGLGWVPLDSVHSPVKRVNYRVETARVGRITDYEKLTLEVWTNGTVKPEDAVSLASTLLKEHLAIFVTAEEALRLGTGDSEVDPELEAELTRYLGGTDDLGSAA